MIAWSLTAISVLWGLLTFWTFRHFTDRAVLRMTRKRLYAHLLGIRLFAEEPSLVWRAQKSVVLENLRLLVLVWKPVLILGLLFAALYGPLDTIYGWDPLPVGRSAVVTLQLDGRDGKEPTLRTPPGITLETHAVTVARDHQVSWRIRPLESERGLLRVDLQGGGEAARSIVTGEPDLSFHSRREAVSGAMWMEVDYPPARVTIAGVSLDWLVWFLLFSTASAGLLTLRRPK